MTENLLVPFRGNRTTSIIFYAIMIVAGIAIAGVAEIGLTLVFSVFDFG
jgi:hypothetical protein